MVELFKPSFQGGFLFSR